MTKRKPKQLGQILLEQGLITNEQLGGALLVEHRSTARSLGRALIEMGLFTESDLVMATLPRRSGWSSSTCRVPVDPLAATLIPEHLARRYRALPIVARTASWWWPWPTRPTCSPSTTSAPSPMRASSPSWPPGPTSSGPSTASTGSTARSRTPRPRPPAGRYERRTSPDRGGVEDAPIVKLVNLLITQAVADRASDIHIEPRETRLRIRYRIDGVLHEVMRSPSTIQAGVISRLKIMADINIAERRVPQDGRMSVNGRRARGRPAGGHPADRATARRSSCGSWTRATRLLEPGRPRLPARRPTTAIAGVVHASPTG